MQTASYHALHIRFQVEHLMPELQTEFDKTTLVLEH